MSRSKLKDKYQKSKYKEGKVDYYQSANKDEYSNIHRLDEMPKNHPSKEINSKCRCVEWLQEPGSFRGHKINRTGHRMVSGIVRAKTKQEIINDINTQLYEKF